MTIRFDDSLLQLARTIATFFSRDVLASGVALRDVNGRLSFVLRAPHDSSLVNSARTALTDQLCAYAREDRVLVDHDDYGAEQLLADKSARAMTLEGYEFQLLDRRLVGADWLRDATRGSTAPPRFVFGSLKGGVGRSTALSVAAAHLASAGRRVLAVDLDMEAPGLGALLLADETLPKFGLIDALVENNLSGLDAAFLADLVGPSSLAHGKGRIDVVPAFGRASLGHPWDILSKLSRAYTEDVRPDGTVATILDQIAELVQTLAQPTRYDVVLLDARAGLHETTAASLLGLGAEVFLFGINETQTFQGYSALLSHVARYSLRPGKSSADWLERLSMVQAKASASPEDRASFAERCRDLFASCGLNGPTPTSVAATVPSVGSFTDIPWDDTIDDDDVLPADDFVREPIAILNDENFSQFNPLAKRDLLSEPLYRATFGQLLDRIDETMNPGK